MIVCIRLRYEQGVIEYHPANESNAAELNPRRPHKAAQNMTSQTAFTGV
jgi:hypothetical protein